MYVQLTIGRNVPASSALAYRAWPGETEPQAMRRNVWEDFKRDAQDLVWEASGVDLADVETHDGIGRYDGVEEESAKVAAYSDVAWRGGTLARMIADVAELARTYEQQTIHLVFTRETPTSSPYVGLVYAAK